MSFDTSSLRSNSEDGSNEGSAVSERTTGASDASKHPNEDGSDSTSEKEDCEETTETDKDEIILSVYWRSGMLGAAVYSVENPVVYLLNDVEDDFLLGFKSLKRIFTSMQPTQIVTCRSMPQKLIYLLNHLLGGHTPPSELIEQQKNFNQAELVGNLHILPDAEFRHQNALRQVLNMRLPEEPQDSEEETHKQFIRSVIDTKKDCMVNALARLLKYLHSNFFCLGSLQNPILAIRPLTLEEQVWVNSEVFETLEIFSHNPHPSLFKWTHGASKEGMSIFGLFNRCQSKLGSKFMRAVLTKPISNQQELNERHEVISFCMDPNNEDVVCRMKSCISKVQNITGMLPRLFAASASPHQWKSLKQTNHNILLLREICNQFAGSATFFGKARNIIHEDLYRVDQLMERVIDFENSERTKKFTVLPGVDEELDEMNNIYGNLSTMMNRAADFELSKLPECMEQCSIHYMPELGFLLTIPMWKDSIAKEEINLPGFEFKFFVDKNIFYKSRLCRELDVSVGDISIKIRELELKIMLRLIQYIQTCVNTLVDSLSFAGELDCLIAFSDIAREFGYVKPILTNKREIIILEGRHPLQEHCVAAFVSNDTHSDESHGFVKIFTGPNASGKSIYIKQIATIAFLAHTGCYVPAKKAIIGVLDQIHTIIQTKEAAASQFSTFMTDLRQMSNAVRMSTKFSLVVADEFGKGTSEVDGMSLIASFLRNITNLGSEKCSHVFISTHFHQLINLVDNSFVKAYILDHLVSDREVVYLYRLKKGRIDSSLAINLARARRFQETTLKRADEILDSSKKRRSCKPVYNYLENFRVCEKLKWLFLDSFIKEDLKDFKEKTHFLIKKSCYFN